MFINAVNINTVNLFVIERDCFDLVSSKNEIHMS